MIGQHHYEQNLLVNGKTLHYRGIFRSDEIFSIINRALEQKGYEKQEKRTEELVTEEGKRSYIELRPSKKKTNYAILMIKIKVTMDNMTEVVEELKGQKRKFDQGNLTVVFDSWLLTDYHYRWNMKPLVYFIKGVINKYVYRFPLEASFPGELVGDTAYIYAQIKKLLDSYKFESGKVAQEKDVMKMVAEEIESGMRGS
ncbi:hypothetical protein COV20_02930 [Candidatus Woesearchaeota archaeon CG10_big_fil_rev_8_21_14_0_10_45_16]|nr:MAG: hypothetical protein COV20_02930 [Candidatus Woesearchaeota archaeon CG10_big_fil_rev_8_21_14_0_10_45_16]